MMSRLDSQGVSACEMQMTGLPIITSDIPGNKEFTTRGTIRIRNDEYSKVESIIDNINNKHLVEKMSKAAHEDMYKLTNSNKILDAEIRYMKEKIDAVKR